MPLEEYYVNFSDFTDPDSTVTLTSNDNYVLNKVNLSNNIAYDVNGNVNGKLINPIFNRKNLTEENKNHFMSTFSSLITDNGILTFCVSRYYDLTKPIPHNLPPVFSVPIFASGNYAKYSTIRIKIEGIYNPVLHKYLLKYYVGY